MTAELSQAQRRLISMIEELDEPVLLLEPREVYDTMIVGLVERFNDTFVVYDWDRVLEHLTEELSAGPYDEYYDPETAALEHYSFNMNGGWYGKGTWGFIRLGSTEVPELDGPADFPE